MKSRNIKNHIYDSYVLHRGHLFTLMSPRAARIGARKIVAQRYEIDVKLVETIIHEVEVQRVLKASR